MDFLTCVQAGGDEHVHGSRPARGQGKNNSLTPHTPTPPHHIPTSPHPYTICFFHALTPFFFTYTKHPIYIDVVRNLHIQSIQFTLMLWEFTMNHCNNKLNHCKSQLWLPRFRHINTCDMVQVYQLEPGAVERSTNIFTNYKTYMSLPPHVACWITCIQPRLYNVCQEELQKKRVDITISILQ